MPKSPTLLCALAPVCLCITLSMKIVLHEMDYSAQGMELILEDGQNLSKTGKRGVRDWMFPQGNERNNFFRYLT
jgi:hypothetical protein